MAPIVISFNQHLRQKRPLWQMTIGELNSTWSSSAEFSAVCAANWGCIFCNSSDFSLSSDKIELERAQLFNLGLTLKYDARSKPTNLTHGNSKVTYENGHHYFCFQNAPINFNETFCVTSRYQKEGLDTKIANFWPIFKITLDRFWPFFVQFCLFFSQFFQYCPSLSILFLLSNLVHYILW